MFVAALDQTVVLTAIPDMLQDVHVPLTQLDDASWIVTGYLLGYVCVLPLMGRMSDVYGRRAIFLASLALFAAGSIACATSRNLWWLVAARVAQAAGGGALLPVTFALVADELPDARRAFWLGAVGAAAEAGGVLGPLYGAAIVQHWGWRWIFWINVPLALAVAVSLHVILSAAKDLAASPTAKLPRRKLLGIDVILSVERRIPSSLSPNPPHSSIDYPGALLFALALAALTVGLSGSADPTRSASPLQLTRAIPLTVAAALLAAAFVWRERRAKAPMMPLALFRRRIFSAANAVNALVGVALIAAMVDVPLFAATVLGREPVQAGLALLRLTVCIPIGALAGGWLAGRLPRALVAEAGLILAAAGFFLMDRWPIDVSDAAMTPGLALAGLGFGLVIAPVTAAALEGAGEAHRALATALVTVMRMAGMTVGLAALTSLAFYRFNQLVSGLRLPLPQAGEAPADFQARVAVYQAGLTGAAHAVFTGVFGVAALICVAACILVPLIGVRYSVMERST